MRKLLFRTWGDPEPDQRPYSAHYFNWSNLKAIGWDEPFVLTQKAEASRIVGTQDALVVVEVSDELASEWQAWYRWQA